MKELIETYSGQDILLFIITLALSIRGFVSFLDWAWDRLKKIFKKESDQEQEMDALQIQLNEHKRNYEVLKSNQKKLKEDLEKLITEIELLIDSDKDDIKSFITERHHHFCYQEGWIDDYSLDCISRRYKHYKDEGGNSFIGDLMNELKALPKQPPNSK